MEGDYSTSDHTATKPSVVASEATGSISGLSSATSVYPTAQALKTQFKTPEGRYRYLREFGHPNGKPNVSAQRPTRIQFLYLNHRTAAPEPSVDPLQAKVLPPPLCPPSPMRLFVSYNISDSLFVNDFNGNEQATLENYRLRSAYPTSHSMIPSPVLSKSGQVGIFLLIGFSTGDIFVQDPVQKSVNIQYNKDGSITPSRVNAVRWLGTTSTVFVSAHSDGSLVFWDTNRDGEQPLQPPSRETERFFVTKSKNTKTNPVSKWTIGTSAIKDVAFSPDEKHFATAGSDGFLRVFDYEQDSIVAVFKSYYGAFTCVCWSPDGKYIATGGEDDNISVFSFIDRSLVARGEGHRSYVSSVMFDPFHCKDNTYRIGSVGQDGFLLLWDFAVESLYKPRTISIGSRRESRAQSTTQNATNQPTITRQGSMASTGTPSMEPFVAGRVFSEPATDLAFLEGCIVVACVSGHVKLFAKMNAVPADEKLHLANLKELAPESEPLSVEEVVDPDSPSNQEEGK